MPVTERKQRIKHSKTKGYMKTVKENPPSKTGVSMNKTKKYQKRKEDKFVEFKYEYGYGKIKGVKVYKLSPQVNKWTKALLKSNRIPDNFKSQPKRLKYYLEVFDVSHDKDIKRFVVADLLQEAELEGKVVENTPPIIEMKHIYAALEKKRNYAVAINDPQEDMTSSEQKNQSVRFF
jgi:hypothetical protein